MPMYITFPADRVHIGGSTAKQKYVNALKHVGLTRIAREESRRPIKRGIPLVTKSRSERSTPIARCTLITDQYIILTEMSNELKKDYLTRVARRFDIEIEIS